MFCMLRHLGMHNIHTKISIKAHFVFKSVMVYNYCVYFLGVIHFINLNLQLRKGRYKGPKNKQFKNLDYDEY